MKMLVTVTTVFLLSATAVFADFSERKLESTKRAAERTAKLIAFVFYDDIVVTKDSNDANNSGAKNNGAKRAVPRADVLIIEITSSDKELDKLPACVKKEGKLPRVIITDGACETVIAQYDGAPDRAKVKEVEALVEEATKFLEKKKMGTRDEE